MQLYLRFHYYVYRDGLLWCFVLRKKVPLEKREAGRTFPFLSMPNEACNWLSLAKTRCTLSRGTVLSIICHWSIWNSDARLFCWQIVICERVVSAVERKCENSIVFPRNWKRKCYEINKLRIYIRDCYIGFDDQEDLPFLYVKATWYHASLLPCAFENRFGYVLHK